MNTNMNERFITLQFNDNIKIKLSTSSFLFKGSNFLQLFDIEEDNNIPIICTSSYVLDNNDTFLFDDKTDLSFMFTLDTTIFINLCRFLDIIEYEDDDTKEQFILYIMKNNITHQLKDLHAFMRSEIISILNYTENKSINIQIRTCTLLFYSLFLSEYKEDVIKYGRIDIYNEDKTTYYKYIHKYNNQLTYIIKETQEYKEYFNNLNTMLMKSGIKNNIEEIKFCIENGANIHIQTDNNNSLLHIASKIRNNIEVIQYLIEHGTDVNFQNNDGDTALHVASTYEIFKTIKYLIKYGANINLQNNMGDTTLHILSRKDDNLDVIQYLVENGVNRGRSLYEYNPYINVQNKHGDTALHCASEREDNLDIIQYLVEHGADINLQDNNGNTALHNASYIGEIKVIKYLVKHGANINLKTNNDNTALELALDTRDSNVIKKMLKIFYHTT